MVAGRSGEMRDIRSETILVAKQKYASLSMAKEKPNLTFVRALASSMAFEKPLERQFLFPSFV